MHLLAGHFNLGRTSTGGDLPRRVVPLAASGEREVIGHAADVKSTAATVKVGFGAAAIPRANSARRGPKGARIGDVVIAEGSRWRVVGIDPGRREAVCQLERGSGVLRRFRARRILRVVRT
jgi:hypothetical protein